MATQEGGGVSRVKVGPLGRQVKDRIQRSVGLMRLRQHHHHHFVPCFCPSTNMSSSSVKLYERFLTSYVLLSIKLFELPEPSEGGKKIKYIF